MQTIQDPSMYQKRQALAAFLHVDPEVLQESKGNLYGFRAFFHGNDEAYLVLTDSEATRAAEHAVSEKLWLICLETLFAYFDIDAYPSDVLGKMKTKEIRRVNEELKTLIYNTTGMDTLRQKMLSYGNRKNLLADYDQAEHIQDGYFIYRLY
ncbi:hypothetical protein [Methanoregula formicica]|uniref:Uncharacterized protein n=1 Tax=Methanoregula formicica (strain DSM 22288 / NBRC 105244 / SMSP) TaxID=593750 RepID=L0HIL4_METFS|nr:hypothetical protein [Methanoregula formicica]AGB03616.1 hypothetical protein Metfor_2624 [Methanoregula formicica SMSP]